MTDLFDIAGKTALVTGGSRGIGLMIARALVAAGARVYIASRDGSACDAAATQLDQLGWCRPLQANLRSEDECRSLMAEVEQREPALHVLVNNAGSAWGAPLEEFDEAAWERDVSVNLKAVFHVTKLAAPLLRAGATPRDPARVINVGSVDGIKPPHHENFAYAASKAGVHHLSRQLAVHLAPDILVNALAPGPFETKMLASILRARRAEVESATVLGRLGAEHEIAGTAVFLASRASTYITGAVIPVDGGLLIN